MLCEFSKNFPALAAKILERDKELSRNFREETITDLLMSSLVAFKDLGITVDFPHEPSTGGDMEWVYAAPLDGQRGRYIRVIIQAKRASVVKLKKTKYSYYKHLDHGSPKGSQANTLMNYARKSPDGKATLPVYAFYHPESAILAHKRCKPAVEGVNFVLAELIEPVVSRGCSRKEKKTEFWRPYFLPLSDFLCWPGIYLAPERQTDSVRLFLSGGYEEAIVMGPRGFHPDIFARRFRIRREQLVRSGQSVTDALELEPMDGIPDDIRRSIDGKTTEEDRKKLSRPRVVFSTNLHRDDPDFGSYTEWLG